MIDVRLIKRTHYQVSEPAYMTLVVRNCTSPISSNFRDRVALRFLEITDDINIAASKYAVDLARSLNLLNPNLVWTQLGHLLNIVVSDNVFDPKREFSRSEKILFLRLFLEFDGCRPNISSTKVGDSAAVATFKRNMGGCGSGIVPRNV